MWFIIVHLHSINIWINFMGEILMKEIAQNSTHIIIAFGKKKPLRKGGMMYFLLGKYGYPQIIDFNGVFHYKLSILGYPYFWKHPYLVVFQSPPNHQPHRKNDPPASCIPSFLVAQGTVVDKLRKFISPLG